MSYPKITALLPMKEISERLPNKNIRLFGEEPLFFHILKTLEKTALIESIIINTDSNTIKGLASSFSKVTCHDRPEEICGGHIPMNTIIDYDISRIEGEFFLQTHCTNPLLSSETLTIAVKKFFDNMPEFDSLFSVTQKQQRLFDKDFKPINHNPQILQNTQDLDPIYEENSCIYLFSKSSFFRNNKNRLGKNPFAFVTRQKESYDIDTEEDFYLAEMTFLLNKKGV